MNGNGLRSTLRRCNRYAIAIGIKVMVGHSLRCPNVALIVSRGTVKTVVSPYKHRTGHRAARIAVIYKIINYVIDI